MQIAGHAKNDCCSNEEIAAVIFTAKYFNNGFEFALNKDLIQM